jgi:amidase
MVGMVSELATLDALAQADLVRTGTLTPLELVEAAIERIESLNPRLNAVITPLFDQALAQANSPQLPAGPFHGVPFLLKDLTCHSAGDPYHLGMQLLKDLGWVESEDTFLAAKFRAAGLVFLGKSNCPELGPITTTEPAAYGPSRNPWNPAFSTGGSSGGSAAAVASGMVPVAHANDGGGSIRIPASECGLVGLKPSRGRTSMGPDVGDTWAGMTAEHVVSRSVRDAAVMLDAVAGPMPGDPYVAPPPSRPFADEVGSDPGRLRVGLLTDVSGRGVEVHPECVAAAREVAKLLESLGHVVEEAGPEGFDDPESGRASVTVITSWTAADIDGWSQRIGRSIGEQDLEPLSWALVELGRKVTAPEYIRAVLDLQAYTRRVSRFWSDGFDLLLTPTIAEPPPLLGEFASTIENPLAGFLRSASFVAFTVPFNITGQPAVSLPLHWSQVGLPIGVQLAAAYGREDLLLRVSSQLEQARPWKERRPPFHG